MVYVILKDDSGCCGCHMSYHIIYMSHKFNNIQNTLNELKIQERKENPHYSENYSEYYVKIFNEDELINKEECYQ